MKKKIFIIIVIVICLVVAIRVGIAIKNRLSEPEEREIKPVPVETYEVSTGDVEDYLLISGISESTNQVEVVSKVSGKIVAIPPTLGSYLYAGSTIAVIDRDEPSLGFKNYVVDAPISGYVAMIMQDVGDFVSAGMPIALLVKRGSTRIKCNVTEKDLPYISEGLEVRIHLNDTYIPGKVTQVSGVIDMMTYSSLIEIKPLKSVEKNNLVPGTFVDIEIPLEIRKDVLIVPKDALITKEGVENVFVVVNDKAELTPVEVGLREKDIVEIKSGLKEGDEVVVVGVGDIDDGSKVRVIEK